MFKKVLLIALCLIAPVAISATLQESHTVSQILAEHGNKAGFYTEEGLPQCLWGVMFIDLSNKAGKAHLSLALSAKMGGLKVVRMDYTVSSEKCFLTGMHIQ